MSALTSCHLWNCSFGVPSARARETFVRWTAPDAVQTRAGVVARMSPAAWTLVEKACNASPTIGTTSTPSLGRSVMGDGDGPAEGLATVPSGFGQSAALRSPCDNLVLIGARQLLQAWY